MHTRCYNFVGTLLVCCVLFFLSGMTCRAEFSYQNPQSGYYIVVDDTSNLLLAEEELYISTIMMEISNYGNVGFYSVNGGNNSRQTEELAEKYYLKVFGDTSGTLFCIDMKARYLYIYSRNDMYDVITTNYANTITDNVYKDATNGNYGTCAIKVYSQMLSLLQGQKISQPMKYISNTLLGITLSFLLTFFLMLLWYKRHIPKPDENLDYIKSDIHFLNTYVTHKETQEIYNPMDNPNRSSSSGGGSFGGGGGGFSGGGGSGGGGGHSF